MSARYIFKKLPDETNEFDNTTVEHTVEGDTLDVLLEAFEAFLRGCTFCPKGTLDFVEEPEMQRWKNREEEI